MIHCKTICTKAFIALVFSLISFTAFSQAPTISSFSPKIGKAGDQITISGTGFNTTASNNRVLFGATEGTVTAASSTELTVTVPVGATYGHINVLNKGTNLTVNSADVFMPTYTSVKTNLLLSDFNSRVEITGTNVANNVLVGDLDGDGKPDMIVPSNSGLGQLYVHRNNSTAGSITTTSFDAPAILAIRRWNGSANIADLDGDGKSDIMITGGDNVVTLMRNISTPGSLTSSSFAPKVDITTGWNPISSTVRDIDGDGKLDMIIVNRDQNTFSVFRNQSTPGSLTTSSFAAKVDFATNLLPYYVVSGDIDGDGLSDVVVANYNSHNISFYKNTSTAGSISFAAKVDFAVVGAPWGLNLADLNQDGKLEILVANRAGAAISIFKNNSSSGTLSLATRQDFSVGADAIGIAAGDVNGDSKPDLIVANNAGNSVSYLRNKSNATTIKFATKIDFPGVANTGGAVIADIDGDGPPEFLFNNYSNTQYNISVSIYRNNAVAGPEIFINESLTPFTKCSGSVSAAQTFTVTGSLLTAPITVAALSGYEYSLDGTTYTSTLSIPQVGGAVNRTVYVRMTAASTGTPAGNISLSSTGTTIETVAVSGSVATSALSISGASTMCAGTSLQLSHTEAGGTWSIPATTGLSISNTGLLSSTAATTATSVVVTFSYPSNGCTLTNTKTISISTLVAGSLAGTQAVCTDGTTTFTSNFAYPTLGNSLNFNGTSNYVSVPHNANLDFNGANVNMTIEAWIRHTGANSIQTIVGKKIGGLTASGYAFYVNTWGTTDRKLRFEYFGDAIASEDTVPQNVWTHVAVSINNGVASFFINGRDAGGGGAVTINASTYPLNIGNFGNNQLDYLFTGNIDDVRIWNVARSQSDIAANYQIGITAQTGLVAYYNFDQGTVNGNNTSITSLTDGSGNAYNGSITTFTRSGTTSNFTTGAVPPVSGVWSSSNSSIASVNSTTGVITGVAGGTATMTYTVPAIGICYSYSNTSTRTVTVNPKPTITYPSQSYILGRLQAISAITPTSTSVQTYSISPALPSGLTFNTSTGIISGTPTVQTSATTYTITGTSSSGCVNTTSLSITIGPIAPTNLSYSPSTQTVRLNAAISNMTPTYTGDAATYSISPALPTGLTFNTSTGVISGTLTTAQTGTATYTVTVSNASGSSTRTITLIFNTAPTDITLTPSSVNENEASGTTVGTLSATDADTGDTFTFALIAGGGDTDNASFTITGNTLMTAGVFDFETKSSYSVRVNVTDAGGLTYEKQLTINVTNVNEAPTNLTLTGNSVAENAVTGTTVGTFAGADLDANETFSYAFATGAGDTDNSSFTITGNTLKTSSVFDFETKSSYSVRVKVTDAGGLTYEKQFTINVTNVNEAPTNLSLTGNSVVENTATGTTVGTLTGTDLDANETFSYAFATGTGDTDNSSFTITGNTLKTAAVFDFETKNSYTIRVKVTDAGGLTYEKQFTINVTNVNEAPTNLTLTGNSVAENTTSGTTVGTFAGTDLDANETFSYAFTTGTGDTDNSSFTITGNALKTAAVFDFETKNSYSVRVKVTDAGGLTYEKQFTISITNVNEAPTNLTLTGNSVAENATIGTTVGTFAGADLDANETFSYAFATGAGDTDNGSFTLTGNTLKTAAVFDFETKNSYSVRIKVTDAGGLTYEKQFTISVTNVNEAPTNLTLTGDSVAENTTSGTTVGTFAGADLDVNETFSYAFATGAGDTDNSSFTITGNTLKTAAVFDFETKSSYTIRVKVTDAGGMTYEKQFTISVTNVNEAPTNTELNNNTIDENSQSGTIIGNLSSIDVDNGDTFSYTLVSGVGSTDNTKFNIVGNTLRSAAVFDFENKNSYTIRVRSTDAGGLNIEKVFNILILDRNDEDTDGDGIPDSVEKGSNPSNPRDTDGDGIPDFKDLDSDNDGVPDAVELTDATDPYDKSKYKDTDGDIVPDFIETLDGTSPTDAKLNYKDSDSDGVPDYVEIIDGTNPNDGKSFKDSDNGGVPDYVESKIYPLFGLSSSNPLSSNDDNRDTDGDGITDYKEVLVITNPNEAPESLSYTPAQQISELGKPIVIMNPTVIRRVNTYSIAPALPAGLVMNTLTGVVSGTRTQSMTGSVLYRITATNNGGSTSSTINITYNTTPSDINATKLNIYEGNSIGDVVGSLNTADVDAPETHTYTLVSNGSNAYDNKYFKITGNQLTAAVPFEYAFRNSYTIRIRSTDSQGQYTEKEFTVTISKRPEIFGTSSEAFITATFGGTNNVSTKPIISKGYTSQLSVVGSDIRSVNWNTSTGLNSTTSLTPTFKYTSSVTYLVTITNVFGSTIQLPFTVEVKDDYFVKPTNIITTRQDGINDYFVVENIQNYADNEVTIYDRNGRILTKMSNYNNRWDGKINGKYLVTDTYYYLIRFTSNPKVVYKGFITLINN